MDALCPLNQKCQSPTTQCRCKSGFSSDRVGTCRDIDECETESHKCLLGMNCSNVVGSYECVENSTGFAILSTTSSETSTLMSTTSSTTISTTYTTTTTTSTAEQVTSSVLVLNTQYPYHSPKPVLIDTNSQQKKISCFSYEHNLAYGCCSLTQGST